MSPNEMPRCPVAQRGDDGTQRKQDLVADHAITISGLGFQRVGRNPLQRRLPFLRRPPLPDFG